MRTCLTIEQKRMICAYYKEYKNLKQHQLILHFTKEFKLEKPIKKSTMSDILIASEKYLCVTDFDNEKKRIRNPLLPDVEEALYMWFYSKRALNIPISDDLLRDKVKDFCDLFKCEEELREKIDNFRCSNGWLAKFKSRYNIKSFKIHGESGDVDRSELVKQRKALKKITNNYKLEDIYNMDETSLFYRLLPTSTLATGKAEGSKLSKERITIALSASSKGEILIGKFAKPRCFKSFNPLNFVHYYYNQSAWMTKAIFSSWVADLNKTMTLQNRNILLLLNNFSGHVSCFAFRMSMFNFFHRIQRVFYNLVIKEL